MGNRTLIYPSSRLSVSTLGSQTREFLHHSPSSSPFCSFFIFFQTPLPSFPPRWQSGIFGELGVVVETVFSLHHLGFWQLKFGGATRDRNREFCARRACIPLYHLVNMEASTTKIAVCAGIGAMLLSTSSLLSFHFHLLFISVKVIPLYGLQFFISTILTLSIFYSSSRVDKKEEISCCRFAGLSDDRSRVILRLAWHWPLSWVQRQF